MEAIKKIWSNSKENKTLFFLVMHSFFSTIFVSIFFSFANAEFIIYFGSSMLPIGYLLSGIVGYFAVMAYGRYSKKNGTRIFIVALFFMLICALVFRSVFFLNIGKLGLQWISFILFLFAMPFISISALQQTGLLLKIYNIQEGKKYAGIINSGGTIAYIIGYLSVPLLIHYFKNSYDLMYVACAGIVLAIYFLLKIYKTVDFEEHILTDESGSAVKSDISLKSLMSQKYIRYIAICGAISTMAYYFVDYSFLINAKFHFNSAEKLTSFIGFFLGTIKIAELILSLFSAKIFRTFGLKAGIIISPVICLFLIVCAIFSSSFSDISVKDEGFLFISIIFGLKFFERIFKRSLEEPTFKNLYQILNSNERLAILAKIEGGTKQLSIILGSAILLLFGTFVQSENLRTGLVFFSLPLFAFWVISAFKLINAFKERLSDVLNSKHAKEKDGNLPVWDKFCFLYNDKNLELSLGTNIYSIIGSKIQLTLSNFQKVSNPPKSSVEILKKGFELEKPILIIPPKESLLANSEKARNEYQDENYILNLALSPQQPDENAIRMLGKKLDEVKNDYEKKLILNILGRSEVPIAASIVLSQIDYPDYYIKKQAYKTLESKNFKFTEHEDSYYRKAIETTLSEITYIISILNSLPENETFIDLINALIEEMHILENRLLSILTWKYDRASIRVIRENIFFYNQVTNTENNILALELIDNLLETENKDEILTVFSNAPYSSKLTTLNKWYFYETLSHKDALINLLNYDYTKLGIWVKACVLMVINTIKSEDYKKIVAGFYFHPNTFLRLLAHQYNAIIAGEPFFELKGKAELYYNSKIGKDKTNLSGEEIYKLVKILKSFPIFRKASSSDIIPLCTYMDLKNHSVPFEFACTGNQKNNPIIKVEGSVLIEYSGDFSLDEISNNYISPKMFDENKIGKVIFNSPSSYYELSPIHLANLAITSDSILNEVIHDSK